MTLTRDALPGQKALFDAAEVAPEPEPEPRVIIHRYLMANQGRTVTELAAALPLSRSSINRHLALMDYDGEAQRMEDNPLRWEGT